MKDLTGHGLSGMWLNDSVMEDWLTGRRMLLQKESDFINKR